MDKRHGDLNQIRPHIGGPALAVLPIRPLRFFFFFRIRKKAGLPVCGLMCLRSPRWEGKIYCSIIWFFTLSKFQFWLVSVPIHIKITVWVEWSWSYLDMMGALSACSRNHTVCVNMGKRLPVGVFFSLPN